MEDTIRLEDLIPRSDNPRLWRKRGGKLIMPALQSEFLDWLLTPVPEREQKTQKDWAEAHGVAATTVQEWKKDRRFRREWEERADAKNIGVDRIQNVIDTLYEAACRGDVNAAKLYMQHVEKLRPPQQVVERDSDVADMSDEELAAEVAALVGDGDE